MAVERQREYETIYILRPTADDQVRSTTSERVKGIVTGAGGHVLTFDDWGSRRLSYRIKDPVDARYHEQGIYQYFRFLAPNDVVAEVERQLRILDTVIKYMTVKVEEDLIPAERLSRVEEEQVFDEPDFGEEE